MKKHSFVLRPSINALGSYRGGKYPLVIAIRVCAAQQGSYFWDSDLKRSIIIKPFSGTGYNVSNARKLQNIIGDFNSRTGVLKICQFFRMGYHFGCKSLLKMGFTFGGLGGTHPPKTYSSTPHGAASAEGYVFCEQEVFKKRHFY